VLGLGEWIGSGEVVSDVCVASYELNVERWEPDGVDGQMGDE